MANSVNQYLDYEGLGKYNAKVQAEINKKVDKEIGKQLSTEDFTSEEKAKLEGLTQYTLTPATGEKLGGVMIETTDNPVPADTALKVDANGKAFVDWSKAPKASESTAGLIKLGAGFKVNEESGAAEFDAETAGISSSVSWSDITDKPDIALKSDLGKVYKYAGSVATYDDLPTEDVSVGDVYNVEDTDMNYGWTGTRWDPLGSTFTIQRITDEQIDALFTSSEEP